MKNPIIEKEDQYGAHHYAPKPVVLTRAEGVYVWDEHDKRYIDMMGAYSAVSHGHTHPALVKVLKDQAEKLAIISRAFYTDKLAPFLESACKLSGYEKAMPLNTGTEAVEAALKAARKWAYKVKGVPEGKAEIIACKGNFHGRTIAVVGLSSESQYKDGFGPFPAGLKVIPYGDADALEAAITPNTAALLIEPIQGEAGIIVPPEGYLKACETICKKHRVLLICDEIQTGLARTGKLFAFQHEGIKPDAITLGKALGGGLLPISLLLSTKEIMDVFTPGDHGSTWGGNPLAAAVGKAALDIMVKEDYAKQAAEKGEYFREQLEAIKSPKIKNIRGKGLLIGLEIKPGYSAHELVLELIKHGILTKETHETVIRLAPPLIITKEQIDEAMKALKAVLA